MKKSVQLLLSLAVGVLLLFSFIVSLAVPFIYITENEIGVRLTRTFSGCIILIMENYTN